MKPLIIKDTPFSPTVCFDANRSLFEIKGSSRPENAVEFYSPVFTWLNTFKKVTISDSKAVLNFIFYFDYLNSISVKLIFDVFKVIEGLNNPMRPITITWNYNKGDTDMKETGEEYQKLVKLPFSIVAK